MNEAKRSENHDRCSCFAIKEKKIKSQIDDEHNTLISQTEKLKFNNIVDEILSGLYLRM